MYFTWLSCKLSYDLVFDGDDGHNDKRSTEKLKKQKGHNFSDDNTAKPRNEGDRKRKHSDGDDDRKRNKKSDEKEKDGRRERKASYSSSDDDQKNRVKKDKRERRRSPSSSDNDERMKRKKKSHADDYSRSHKVSNCLLWKFIEFFFYLQWGERICRN